MTSNLQPQPIGHSKPDGAGSHVFPWENLTFEGGGAKGYAYIGAIKCLEEAGIYPRNIRRVAGTSIGSLFAVLTSMGCSSDYMVSVFPQDFQVLAKDGPGGKMWSFVRAAKARGMHPGQRLYDFLGEILNEHAGQKDITFAQMYEVFGRELCIPVTNVTRMMTEYCHLKTTPNMPVRLAARMSMSLPVLLQPVALQNPSTTSNPERIAELYVDGGLLCNNPTHTFDGWWLSLRKEDSFLRRIKSLETASQHYPRSARFGTANEKTLGFTLFSESESDITRAWVSPEVQLPERPETPAAKRCTVEEEGRKSLGFIHAPIQRLFACLDEVDADENGRISEDELVSAIDRAGLTGEQLLAAFATTDVGAIFSHIDKDADKKIDFAEILNFLESIGIDITTKLVGFPARHPKTVVDFAMNLLEAVSRDLTRANQQPIDQRRTSPINTDYVGTTTFDLEKDDLDFLIETGRIHTQSFLNSFLGKQV
jgi:Ca2+-binding EF-hand superfamily protein